VALELIDDDTILDGDDTETICACLGMWDIDRRDR
jgi:hypothetical protein